VTDAITRITGYTMPEIFSGIEFFKRLILREDYPLIERTLSNLLGNIPDSTQLRIQDTSGVIHHLRYMGYPIYDSVLNRVVRVIGACQDVTLNILAEEALFRAHEELDQRVRERTAELAYANQENKMLISALGSILIRINPNNQVTYWNSIAAQTLGISTDASIGNPFCDLPLQWDWQKVKNALYECNKTNQKVRMEDLVFTRPTGEEYC
jgi:PAS domain-containing protein